MILYTILLAAVLLVVIDLWRCPRILRHLYYTVTLPGPWRLPIIGTAYMFFFKNLEEKYVLYQNLVKTYGDVYRMWMGNQVWIVFSNPTDIQAILTSKKCINKGSFYRFLHAWLNEGLLTSSDKKWHTRRKILTPAYHFQILEQFVGVFNKHSDILMDKMKTFSSDDKVDMKDLLAMLTLDVICETSMGTCVNAQSNDQHPYVVALRKVSDNVMNRGFSVLLYEDDLYQFSQLKRDTDKNLAIMHGFTDSVIKKRRAYLRDHPNANEDVVDEFGSKKKTSFLDILLLSEHKGEPLTDLDIREEVDTFMFEGHDTVTSAMHFAMYNIARHPEVQQKCLAEIYDVAEDDQPFTMGMLNRLPYMDLVIKETERMYPSVFGITRTITEDIEINGRVYPAGVDLAINIFCLGRNPKVHKDPDVFRPERFDTTVVFNDKTSAFTSVPFSAGYRNCIGQKFAELELKSVLVKMLRNFEIQLHPDSMRPPQLMGTLVLDTCAPINFQLKRRQQQR